MRRLIAASMISLTALVVIPTTLAAAQILEYRIKHPTFGDIGTYVNTVSRNGAAVDVVTRIDIRVSALGAVLYRQQAARRERWDDGRLTAFRSVTETNGKRVEVTGDANGSSFLVSGPQGLVVAPANVHPANPWSPRILDAGAMLSPASGRVHPGRVIGATVEQVRQANGTTLTLKRYDIETDKRQVVWFDDAGIVRAFRTEQDGTPIDFVLVRQSGSPDDQRAEGTTAPR